MAKAAAITAIAVRMAHWMIESFASRTSVLSDMTSVR